jgi:small-conductance mechanosensitive channel
LSFTLLCWTSLEQFFLTRSELTVAVNNVFSEARIEIPFPQQEIRVQLQEQQPRAAQVVSRQITETAEQERIRLSTRSQASSK